MSVLVINCGSTSIKASIIDPATGDRIESLKVERIHNNHADALRESLPRLLAQCDDVECVGHRVVHGGRWFTAPTLIDDEVFERLQQTIPLAPLHNPANLAGIEAVRQLLDDKPHIAVFDTAFHATLPRRAASYALPHELADKHHLRRYGFHGTSHHFVARAAAEFLDDDLRNLRVITCHLGGGCSICAVEYGRSVETSMGTTPLEGLVMATRSGDVDAGAVLHLMREESLGIEEADRLLNRQSGLHGLTGGVSDFRDIEQKAEEGDDRCRLAINVFCHRLRKYIGAYAAVMGGVDAIVFTAGIGQNSATVRHRVCQRLDFLGARLDEYANREAQVSRRQPVAEISAPHSRVKLLAVATDEALEIARASVRVAKLHWRHRAASEGLPPIPVAISARHIHLTQPSVEALFGEGHQLTSLKPLSQPGQFAANETVTLVGPKRSIEGVRVLGPTRSKDQVEISRTDEFYLGIDAPIRASGDVENSPGITLLGSEGRQLTLDRGVICAWRHIHMTPEDAELYGVEDRELVEVEVGNDGVRSLTFGDVMVRVKSSYKLEMHIDTDEGNAAELSRSDIGHIDADEDTLRAVGEARINSTAPR